MKHWLFLALLVAAVAGCDSPLVGASCRTGYTLCDGVCVNLHADFRNCGACGHSCGPYICADSVCSKTMLHDRDGGVDHDASDGSTMRDGSVSGDGGLSDASKDASSEGGMSDGSTRDGSAADGGTSNRDGGNSSSGDGGLNPDSGLGGCSVGQQVCSDTCSNPALDPANCGACGNVCASNLVCSLGSCSIMCDVPLVLCGDQCFDLSEDVNNCGGCGNRCTSGICEDGMCADAVAGQAVVIGHDFVGAANNAMRRVAGNAVFLGRGAPVRVLVYRGDAADASVTGVESAIDFAKGEIGRDWRKINAVEEIVPLQLATADVLLVHSQAGASNSTLMKLGQEWGNALAQFLLTGGVVVVFETPSTNNDGTFQILEPAMIFAADSRESVTLQQLKVKTPGMGVAVRVPDRYMSASETVHFNGVSTPGDFVVVDRDSKPVVIQRVIVPQN